VHGDARRAQLGLHSEREGGSTAGANKTPAPTRPYDARLDGYQRTWGRDPSSPSSNGYAGPVSLNPGERAPEVALAKQSQPDTTLDVVRSKSQKLVEHDGSGVDRMLSNSQMRDIKETNRTPHRERVVPTHPGTTGARRGPTVPAVTGNSAGAPVRKPGA
jgi:hypothetical protein